MSPYYAKYLAGEKLRQCYDLAGPRIRQYLAAEVDFVCRQLRQTDQVLELGCGYGRILPDLAKACRSVTGIDSSSSSVAMARTELKHIPSISLVTMDAGNLAFKNGSFEAVACIQNGISAFKIEPEHLILECLRVLKPGGLLLLSSYAEEFWEHRIEWFIAQSEAGLLGEIDWEQTSEGVIVCKDGFRATTFTEKHFRTIMNRLELDCEIQLVDQSSLFCLVQR